MAQEAKVLNCIAGAQNRAGFEVAAAFAAYAASEDCGFAAELWVPGAEDSFGGVPNRAAHVRRSGGVAAVLALRRFLLAEPPAVVHCHDTTSARTLSIVRAITDTPPAVYGVYAPLPGRTPRKPLRDMQTRAFMWSLRRVFPTVIAPSAYAREVIISRSGFSPDSVVAVPFGVEPDGAPACDAQPGEPVRVALLPVEAKRGRRHAAFSFFLQGARIVLRQAAETLFILSCRGDDEDYVNETAHTMGITERVKVSSAQSLFQTLSAADIAVAATGDFEGVRALVHAMAAGKAIIAPDLRWVREFVEPETTALLIRASDSQSLADSILRLTASASERTRLCAAAAAAARSRFTARRMARDLAQIYRRIAAPMHG